MDPALDGAELAAMRAQWSGFPGALVRPVGALEVFAAQGPGWLRQVRGVVADTLPADLAAALELAPGARVPVAGGAAPAALQGRGYRPDEQLLRLAAAPRAEPPRHRVEVAGPDDAELVEQLAGTGFGLALPGWWSAPLGAPGWTQVVAFEDDRAVATGGLHLAGEVGWVGATATLPQWRGRRAHQSLLAARLRIAAARGATRVGVKVSAGSASHRNLLRAGFREVDVLTEWAQG